MILVSKFNTIYRYFVFQAIIGLTKIYVQIIASLPKPDTATEEKIMETNIRKPDNS